MAPLIEWRQRCYKLGLIGLYPDGVGFGNISCRYGASNQFIISGTQTGGTPTISAEDFTLVTDYSIPENWLSCTGPLPASSESLTHAAVYQCSTHINAVIHVHHRNSWETLLNNIPTTGENIPYGTLAMAQEIHRLYHNTNLPAVQIVAMAGHSEGIIAFGETITDAGNVLLETLVSFL